jgi:hypothetical protein
MRDLPEKAPGIEIYSIDHYLQARRYYNGYGLLLHEYCHILHQFVLPDGLNNITVQTLHHKAMLYKAQYQSVYRRDWILSTSSSGGSTAADRATRQDMAYALINPYEYFAELSVSYLCNGYRYLECLPSQQTIACCDHRCFAAQNVDIHSCCPPLLPNACTLHKEEVVHMDTIRCDDNTKKDGICNIIPSSGDECNIVLSLVFRAMPWVKDIISSIQGVAPNEKRMSFSTSPAAETYSVEQNLWHCGNFYPFTNHQLKRFDFEAFQALDRLWRNTIENWREH